MFFYVCNNPITGTESLTALPDYRPTTMSIHINPSD